MRPERQIRQEKLRRVAQLEHFEERLTFSAQPLSDPPSVDVPQLEQFGTLDRTPDFILTGSLDGPSLEPFLADAHKITGVEHVHDLGIDGSGQTVVVIDSGVAWDHISLGAGLGTGQKIVGGWDFSENDANPYDDGPHGFHGTHVTGIIGSEDPIHRGVAPGADIVSLRVFNDAGEGMFEWVEEALRWVHQNRDAFENPITTVNLSLGASWNAETVPSWAMLEDELRQLENDGIFIAAAAGNSFGTYAETGLAYPAASPYVVPVGSVTNDNVLSAFSQRSDRMLVAPGQRIMSTIPDHATTAKDGRVVDFGVASGTSMASPYVAGSAILVRQAMQSAGYTNITQDQIYDHLRATADPIYDAVTNATYFRIDVLEAVQALAAADDYGNTPAEAHSLGAISQSLTVQGGIQSSSDRDYFSFVATHAGSVSIAANGVPADWSLPTGARVSSGGDIALEVEAGQLVTFGIGSTGGIGAYSIQVQLQRSSDATALGRVELVERTNQAVSGEARYTLAATHTGLLAAKVDAGLQIQWWKDGILHASGAAEAMVATAAGEDWELRVTGQSQAFQLAVANQVAVAGNLVTVHGSQGDDLIHWNASERTLTLSGFEYDIAGRHFTILGGAGNDELIVEGGRWNALLASTYAQMQSNTGSIYASEVEKVRLAAGGGDVTLIGSAGDETLVADAMQAELRGDGYRLKGEGYGTLHVIAGGGNDAAVLSDSNGNDQFFAYESQVLVRGNMDVVARGFEDVQLIAENGGDDQVFIYDSFGDDRFYASPEESRMERESGVLTVARGFERVYGRSTDGDDIAYLTGSAGDDRLTASVGNVFFRGSDYYVSAQSFGTVEVDASQGGYNTATFYDSAGDDRFTAMPGYAVMRGDDFRHSGRGFQWVAAFATSGGLDTASLYDSPHDDQLTLSSHGLQLKSGETLISARKFEVLKANSIAGGQDTAIVAADWDTTSQHAGRTYLGSEHAVGEASGFLLSLPMDEIAPPQPASLTQTIEVYSTLPVVSSDGYEQAGRQLRAAVFAKQQVFRDATDELDHDADAGSVDDALSGDEIWPIERATKELMF